MKRILLAVLTAALLLFSAGIIFYSQSPKPTVSAANSTECPPPQIVEVTRLVKVTRIVTTTPIICNTNKLVRYSVTGSPIAASSKTWLPLWTATSTPQHKDATKAPHVNTAVPNTQVPPPPATKQPTKVNTSVPQPTHVHNTPQPKPTCHPTEKPKHKPTKCPCK